MSSNTISPSIDQGAVNMFQDNFHELAQQTKSKLAAAGAIKYLPPKGKTTNYGRMGRIELDEVNTRNPDKQYGDYSLDNRQFSKRRFTKTITIDAKHDINELIKDPTSSILTQLNNAKERMIDRIAIAAAVGSVLTGAPDTAPTSTTAANDGVLTVDATAGLTYEKVLEITENFINNELEESDIEGSVLCISGSENTDLMSEIEFISNDYINEKPVKGMPASAGIYRINRFAGSKLGGIQVTNPILPEGTTTRQCVVLAPESIVMTYEVALLNVKDNPNKVNSVDITIDLWINAMRTEGVRVQIVTTTI